VFTNIFPRVLNVVVDIVPIYRL